MPHDRQVVGDEDVGEAEFALQVGQQVDDLRLDGHVERGHRLVADDELGPERERPGHADALPLPAGELGREPVEVLGVEPDELHHLLDPALALLAGRRLVDGEGVADDRPDPAARVERPVRVLEDHLHLAPVRAHPPRRQGADVVAVEDDPAGGEVVQPRDAAGERGLAAAGLADEPEGLPAAYRQAHPVNGMHHGLVPLEELSRLHREMLDDVLHPQQDVRVGDGGRWCGCCARVHRLTPHASACAGSALAHDLAPTSLRAVMSCGSQHADRWVALVPTAASGGTSVRHLSMT